MTKEEYDLAQNAASMEYDKKRREINREYALSNSPYKVGDKITDHVATIEIQSIKHVTIFSGTYPECIYTGIQLNKDGKPSKRQDHNTIYQSNIVK